jgi:DNA-binding IclR family transcriptional regulator
MRSVAAPVVIDDRPVGSVAVTGPARRMTGERFRTDLPNLILAATNEIELKLHSETQ